MNKIHLRFILFLCFCIIIRLSFVLTAKYIDKKYLPYLGLIALIPAIGFITIYLGDFRKTGGEVFGEKIWWNDLRPIHASLYILFSLLAFKKSEYAYIPLLTDVVLGLFFFLKFHLF